MLGLWRGTGSSDIDTNAAKPAHPRHGCARRLDRTSVRDTARATPRHRPSPAEQKANPRLATGSFDRWRLAEQSAIRTLENGRLTQRAYSLGEVDLQALLLARRQTVEAADSALNARVLALRSYYSLLVDAQLIWDLDRL